MITRCLLYVLLGLALCGCGLPTPEAEPTPSPPLMGQDIAVGAITWRVDAIQNVGNVLQGNGHEARSEWGFVIVDTTVTNHGTTEIKIVPPVLYTSKHHDIEYQPTHEMIQVNLHPCAYNPITVGETKTCRFIYALPPSGGEAARLEVSDSDPHNPTSIFIELRRNP